MIVRLEVAFSGQPLRHLAVVQVPRVLPRLVELPSKKAAREYIFLGRLIGHFLPDLFPGTKILDYWHFRITRNSELYIDEEEAANLLKAVENELHNRRKGDAVRLEIDANCPPDIQNALLGTFRLKEDDLYLIDGPLNPTQLMAIYEGEHLPVPRTEERDRAAAERAVALPQRDEALHPPEHRVRAVLLRLDVDALVVELRIDDDGQIEALRVGAREAGVPIAAPLHRRADAVPVAEVEVVAHPDLVAVVDDRRAREREEQRVHQLEAAPVVPDQRREPPPDAEVHSHLRVGGVGAVHVIPLFVGDHFERELVVIA